MIRGGPFVAEHVHPEWEDFGALEWTAVVLGAALVIWAIWRAVKYTLEPGEQDADHIKRMILEPETPDVSARPDGGVPSASGDDVKPTES